MKGLQIAIVGTRGIPAKYGGFETFAEEISVLLTKKGLNVTVYCDNNKYQKIPLYKGVNLKYQRTIKSKHSLFFYLEGIFKALKENDLIIIAGTGGSFFYFLNIFFRKKIITNTDGVESRRNKWSFYKKRIIKISEKLTVKYSDYLIADSFGIKNYLLNQYPFLDPTKIKVIEYGAWINNYTDIDYLTSLKLTPNNYYLIVCRLEPENNVHMIIDGYNKSNTKKPLVIVGNLTHNEYVNTLINAKTSKIFFLGGIYEKKKLMALRYSAFAYIHGHSVGGTNPSLLEALASSNISICHDNIFNREVTANNQLYFSNAEQLKEKINLLENMSDEEMRKLKYLAKNRIENYYSWENIANKYYNLISNINS
jgi:rhamnosyltransferase